MLFSDLTAESLVSFLITCRYYTLKTLFRSAQRNGCQSLKVYCWAAEKIVLESLIKRLPYLRWRPLHPKHTLIVVHGLLVDSFELGLFYTAPKSGTMPKEFAIIEGEAVLSVLLGVIVLV
jgi:hypothetical protein